MLCIAYYFPPVACSGTHRTRAVVRHLPCYGWRSVVVTARPDPKADVDRSLLACLPEDLVVYRTPAPHLLSWGSQCWSALSGRRRSPDGDPNPGGKRGGNGSSECGWVDWASRWMQVPDMTVGWIPWGARAACRAVRRHRCDAIYSSAPQWSAHLIALLVKSLTGLPWVADFRDPWRASPFRKMPYPSVDRYDAWLEERVVRTADWVVCNSDPVRKDFMARFPERSARFVTVPNGFDPEDFVDLKPRRPAGPDCLLLTHVGWFYGPRRPDGIFRAIRLLEERGSLGRPVCLQLVGSPHYDGKSLQGLAARYGVGHAVRLPGEVPHREALERMRGSDIQLLVGFNGPGADLQVPGKLFEYLGVGRPVLALASPQSAIADVIRRAGIRGEVCDPDDPEQIAAAVLRLAARPNGCVREQGSGSARVTLGEYDRRRQVGRIAELLRRGVA